MTVIKVAPAFQGIPGVAHGGYLAGLLAQRFVGTQQVRFRRPPPIDTPLTIEENGDGFGLHDPEGRTVMLTRPVADVSSDLPVRTVEQLAGHAAHPGYDHHPYPGCFMCGTSRDDGFKLRVNSIGDGLTAGVWRPASPLLPDDAAVPPQFVWAAIDCLTAWAFADHWSDPDWWPALTGRMTVTVTNEVRPGRDHVVLARVVDRDGRRITAQAVVADADGQPCARSEATWVVVPTAPGDQR